ncbi:hypothetical protein [Streptomyces hyaluromycini]|uniref:hypothetical protein n=1 Tax=Streptomyces hyaluromycini TaxID=1377993 RepID=UPI000B5C22FC|nr:hypothetical protein [Streptomyces hyaluromycini]
MSEVEAVIIAIQFAVIVALLSVIFSREHGRTWYETVGNGARVFRWAVHLCPTMLIIYVTPDAVGLIQQRF